MLSKLGLASRTQAAAWVAAGRVAVNGHIVRDPERATDVRSERIAVDGCDVAATRPVYLMLHKPRGLVTTTADEHGRDTVYRVLHGAELPWLAPVGRLDKASEGLLLMSNDTAWSASITAPASALVKTYHVQIDRLPDAVLLSALARGIVDRGERLAVVSVRELRRGQRHAWLEIGLDEGRNRHIRRLLAAFGIGVLRLVRVAIGGLTLGTLGKGQWRLLDDDDRARIFTAPES